MANDISSRVWFLDTQAVVCTFQVRIITIEWINPQNIGDVYILQDNAGKTVAQGRCEVALQTQVLRPDQWANGLNLVQLGSGFLEITIR